MATTDAIRSQFDRSHGVGTTLVVLALTVVGALGATWLLADLVPRLVAFALSALVLAVVFYGAHDGRDLAARALYGLAAFVVLIPVMVNMTYLFVGGYPGVDDPWAFVLTGFDLQLLLVAVLVALVPFAIGYYLRNAPAVRARLASVTGRGGGGS